MIRIAVCDDDKKEIENVVESINSYARAHSEYKFSVQPFDNGDALLKHVQKNADFDIYLLDIVLKEGDLGTFIAKKLREMGKGGEIIFVTSSKDYAVEAFSLNATHYVMKPFSKASFDAALDRAIINLKVGEQDIVFKSTNLGVKKVLVSDIVYSESSGHYQYIYLKNETLVKVRMKTQELWDELSRFKQFFKPHTGFIVNRDYVKGMAISTLTVQNGVIPLSKNSYKKVRQEYLDYVFGKGDNS